MVSISPANVTLILQLMDESPQSTVLFLCPLDWSVVWGSVGQCGAVNPCLTVLKGDTIKFDLT